MEDEVEGAGEVETQGEVEVVLTSLAAEEEDSGEDRRAAPGEWVLFLDFLAGEMETRSV